jgi:hypothetical protein
MTRALLTLTLAFALLAGCGGDDEGGEGGGGDALSKKEFVAEANKICSDGEKKITETTQDSQEKIQQAGSQEEQQKVVADVLEDTAKEYDPYLERLDNLKPPQELEDGWDKFITGVRDAFDLIPELADATRDGDREKLEDLTKQFTEIAEDTRPFAQTNGLDECLPDNTT